MIEFIINLLWAGIEGLFWFVGGSKKKKVVNGCKPCYELKGINDIKDEKHLTLVIRKLRKQLAVCSFKETTPRTRSLSGAFLKLPITAPWPNYIEYYFQCIECKAEYRLSVDTFGFEKHNSIQGEFERY